MVRQKITNNLAILLSVFILYTSGIGPFEILIQRSIFAAIIICLGLAIFPLFKGKRYALLGTIIDIILAIISVVACVIIARDHAYIMEELPSASGLSIFLTTILLITILDACRRTVGWAFTIIVLVMLLYSIFGHFIPGKFGHKVFSVGLLAETLYLSDLGIWGSLTGIGATYVGVFIMFGVMLLYTGGGQTFINIAALVGGKSPGGAAKIAIVASGIFGMMSGNSVGNVATTGNVTIPLMKRLGYRPALAGAIEAVASTGGQITPPILGAVAFVIAETLGVSYWYLAVTAIIPAFLFYLSLYVMINTFALRMNLGQVDEKDLPTNEKEFSWARLLPLAAGVVGLAYGVIQGNSLVHSVFFGIVGIIVTFLILQIIKGIGLGGVLIGLVETLQKAGHGLVMVGILLIGAQVLVCLVNATGIAGTISGVIVDLAGNNLLAMAIITAIVSLIMGMGLPTLPAYVLVAAILAPPLIKVGVDPLAAHMFVFYYACLSAITPPVAAAVFVAAGIANTSWTDIAKYAMKLGSVTYFMPMMFIYYPGMLTIGGWSSILYALTAGLVVTFGFAYFFGGQKLTGIVMLDRILPLTVIALVMLNEVYWVAVAVILTVILIVLARKMNAAILNGNKKTVTIVTESAAAQS